MLFGAAALINRCRTSRVCKEGIEMRKRGSRLPTTAFSNALLPAGGRLPTTLFFFAAATAAGGPRSAAERSDESRAPASRRKLLAPEPPLAALWRCGPRSLSCKHAVAAAPGAEAAPEQVSTKAPHHSTPTAPRRKHVTNIQAQSA